jgi:hypothetical protein
MRSFIALWILSYAFFFEQFFEHHHKIIRSGKKSSLNENKALLENNACNPINQNTDDQQYYVYLNTYSSKAKLIILWNRLNGAKREKKITAMHIRFGLEGTV